MLTELSVDQMLNKARSFANNGNVEEAQKLYQAVLETKKKLMQQELATLKNPIQTVTKKSLPKKEIDQLAKLYKLGKFSVVVRKTQALTKQYPEVFLLWNLFGASASQLGMFDEAISAFQKLISLNPNHVDAYYNIGNVLKDHNKLEEAIKAYNKVISLQPNYVLAYGNMGVALQMQGKLDEAIKTYEKAISLKSDYILVYFNMGNALQAQGKLNEAIKAYNKVISLQPNYAEAYHKKGNILRFQAKLEEAIKAYNKAILLQPDCADIYYNMGNALKDQNKFKEAIEAYKKAISLKPNYVDAYGNMGNALKDQEKFDKAIEAYKNALSIKPDYDTAYNNIGVAFQDQGKLDEAIKFYKKAIAINPNYAEAHCNMGNALQDLGNFDEAIKSNNKAIMLKPNYVDAYLNCSSVYNLQGNLQKGLEFFEWRLKKKYSKPISLGKSVIWDGSKSIKRKKVIVFEEQGLGDIIQFCRYLPLLKQKGPEITFKVKQKMHALLRVLEKDVILTDSFPNNKKFDFAVPLMSLPLLLKTNLQTIPSMMSYIFADEKKVKSWSKRLTKETFKVGICWQGSKNKIDFGRSFPLSLFEGISKLPNVELISLHQGEGEEQIKDINFDLFTLGNNFDAGDEAFLDTAAVIVNCDLVITSDTAIAHLAGALGCKTWVALQKIPDWRWFLDRNDSPWYPNMKLYRQKQYGNWEYVFKIIKKDLQLLLKQEKSKK